MKYVVILNEDILMAWKILGIQSEWKVWGREQQRQYAHNCEAIFMKDEKLLQNA